MISFMKLLGEVIDKMNKAARPYLTILIATVFNVICAWAVIEGKLDVQSYITAIAPTNAMIIGFWFGEKAALSAPAADQK